MQQFSPLAAMMYVQQQGEMGKQRGEQSRLARLVSQGMSSPGGLRAIAPEVASFNPEAAFALEDRGAAQIDQRRKLLSDRARLLSAMPVQQRAQAWPSMRAELAQLDPELGTLPEQYDDAQFGPVIQQLAGLGGANDLPSDIRTLQYLQQNPDLLAINDRFRGTKSFKEITLPNGQAAFIALDNRSGMGEVAPVGGGAPQPTSNSLTPQIDAVAQQANALIAAGASPEQVDAWVQMAAQGSPNVQVGPPQAMPAPMPRAGSIGLGQTDADRARAAAEKVAMEEAARRTMALQYSPQETEAAATREAAVTTARETATAQATRAADQVSKNTAFEQYQAARDDLLSSLQSTVTGPLAGRVPAMTEAQQTAEGAQARMAPILKGLFRTAGEGTFTDKDQQLLMAMVPTRTDLPGAVEAKIRGIDAIVQAKLGQRPQAPGGDETPPVPGARKAPDGNWYLQQDGGWFKVEQ